MCEEEMARGKYITTFELDLIRVAHANGCKAPSIARYMGRTKMAVYNKIEQMRKEGTLDDVPVWLPSFVDDIVRLINDA